MCFFMLLFIIIQLLLDSLNYELFNSELLYVFCNFDNWVVTLSGQPLGHNLSTCK